MRRLGRIQIYWKLKCPTLSRKARKLYRPGRDIVGQVAAKGRTQASFMSSRSRNHVCTQLPARIPWMRSTPRGSLSFCACRRSSSSLEMAVLFPLANVGRILPHPRPFCRLCRIIYAQLYSHIVLLAAPHALSDESGSIEFAGAVMDVTIAKQAEGRIRQIIETIPDYAWSTEPDGSIDFFNQRVLEFIGLPKEDLLRWGWRSAVHPDELARLVDEWRAALAIGEPLKSEARVLRANGEYCWWLIRSAPLHDELGNIVKWYGTGIDIEDRKRGEEAQRQAQADLARVNRVTTMGELTASLAHEVKQPIAAASTNARTCLRWLAGDTPNVEEARAAAMRIVKDAQRATEIIGRTSLLFKKGSAQRELVDVNEVIREMIVLLRSEATRYSISVRTELAAELPQVMGDHVQLQQVLMNLMINGIDAMKDADGTREW